MKTKTLKLITLLVLGALLLSACSSRGGVVNSWHGLAADADRAYVSAGSFIYAVDLKNGSEVWRYPEKADGNLMFLANPVLTSDGQLLIGSVGKNHEFLSLDPATGKTKWGAPFSGAAGQWVGSPLVMNDTIYAPNADGYLYILGLDGSQKADPIEIGGTLWSAPVSDGSRIYVNSLDHHVHIINLTDPAAGASADLGGAIPSSPVLGNDGAYVSSLAGAIEFVQPDGTFSELTKTDSRVWGSPTMEGNTLYYADLSGKVYSYNLTEKVLNWSVTPNGPVVAGLLVAGDQVYVACEGDPVSKLGTLVALDAQGKTLWSKEVGGQLYTTPVLSGDLVLVAPYTAAFTLAAYDTQGRQAWTFTPAK